MGSIIPDISQAPSTHELAQLNESQKAKLEKLKTDVEDVAKPENAKKETKAACDKLQSAILTGKKAQVKIALQELRYREDFQKLRGQIDELHKEMEGEVDQAVTSVEQAVQAHVPNWARIPLLGMIAGGTIIAASLPIKLWGMIFGSKKSDDKEKGLSDHMTSFGKVLIGVGMFGGLVKGGMDWYQQKTWQAILPPALRNDKIDPELEEQVAQILKDSVVVKQQQKKGGEIEQYVTIPGIDPNHYNVEGLDISLYKDGVLENRIERNMNGTRKDGKKAEYDIKQPTHFKTNDRTHIEIAIKMKGETSYTAHPKITIPIPKLKTTP